eukprot:SAG31_NODE_58_length_29669_cov_20.244978_4_plen_111_part_00
MDLSHLCSNTTVLISAQLQKGEEAEIERTPSIGDVDRVAHDTLLARRNLHEMAMKKMVRLASHSIKLGVGTCNDKLPCISFLSLPHLISLLFSSLADLATCQLLLTSAAT